MLFLLAAGLTLVFGIMDMINLAHGSLYMVGAFLAATVVEATGSFLLGVAGAVAATALVGMAARDGAAAHALSRATTCRRCSRPSPLILILNEVVRMIWGAQPTCSHAAGRARRPGRAAARAALSRPTAW